MFFEPISWLILKKRNQHNTLNEHRNRISSHKEMKLKPNEKLTISTFYITFTHEQSREQFWLASFLTSRQRWHLWCSLLVQQLVKSTFALCVSCPRFSTVCTSLPVKVCSVKKTGIFTVCCTSLFCYHFALTELLCGPLQIVDAAVT